MPVLKDLQMGQSDDQFSSSSLEYMLTQLHAGGVVMDAFQMHTFAQTRHDSAKMHKHAAIPLLRAADGEGGYVERLQHPFGYHPGADEAATPVIALKLASHLMLALPHSAEKGAIKKLPLKMSATCTPYFRGKQHKTLSAKGEKGKIKKLPLKISATCTLFPGSRGTVPPTAELSPRHFAACGVWPSCPSPSAAVY